MTNQQSTYTTRTEAIDREIIEPIEAAGSPVQDAAAEYNIDAIADAVLDDHAHGYACKVTAEQFWEIVAAHAR